jgi:hypothetical protein
MDMAGPSKTMVNTKHTARCHIPEHTVLQIKHCVKLSLRKLDVNDGSQMKSEIEPTTVHKINKPVDLTNRQDPYACIFL